MRGHGGSMPAVLMVFHIFLSGMNVAKAYCFIAARMNAYDMSIFLKSLRTQLVLHPGLPGLGP